MCETLISVMLKGRNLWNVQSFLFFLRNKKLKKQHFWKKLLKLESLSYLKP